MQSVTCNKSPLPVKSNIVISGKNINPIPLNSQSTDLHLNEIDRALNEVESGKNSIHIKDPSTLLSLNHVHIHQWIISIRYQTQKVMSRQLSIPNYYQN